MTPLTKVALESWLPAAMWELRLYEWTIIIKDEPSDDTTYAQIEYNVETHIAELYLCRDWELVPAHVQLHMLTHELVHLLIEPFYAMVVASHEPQEGLRVMMESTVDNIAALLVDNMPAWDGVSLDNGEVMVRAWQE